MGITSYDERVQAAITAGDVEALLDVALEAHRSVPGLWSGHWDKVLTELRGLRMGLATQFAEVCAARYRPESEEARAILLAVAVATESTPAHDTLGAERRAEMDRLALSHDHWGSEIRTHVIAEVAAGRGPSPLVLALLRRKLALVGYPHESTPLAQRFTEPVLNVGEAWSDRAMADLDSLPEPWRRVVALVITANSPKPKPRWEKAAQALIAEIGAEAVRETVVSWLELVGEPRTVPLERAPNQHDVNSTFDPYNTDAVRGLAFLLAHLPADPRSTRVLGALVETALVKVDGLGRRSPKIANAAALALSRLDGGAVTAELARLATAVSNKSTRKLIDEALATRAVGVS